MGKIILGIISSGCLIVIGLWKFFRGRSKYKKELMKEAKEDLDNAHENKDESSILDAWDKSSRV